MNGTWSPDGRRIAFRSNRSGVYDLYVKDASGVGEEELLVKSAHTKFPTGWSPEGRFLLYMEFDPKTKSDIWVLPVDGERKPFPFLKTEFNESHGTFSPVPDSHGRLWMAYNSDETGRNEIYLRPFLPGASGGPAGAKVRVSTGGGGIPRWRRDGRELFYIVAGKLMAVDLKLGASVEIGTPHALFEVPPDAIDWISFADGRRFLYVVLNWTAELKR
jgi:Tol biopolymer transport system component